MAQGEGNRALEQNHNNKDTEMFHIGDIDYLIV